MLSPEAGIRLDPGQAPSRRLDRGWL